MGVGKDMKNFIASMTEQTGFGGYGAKIKSTPMGPFRWNDMIQLWENVNNGMVMNNVSFQDMFIMGYETNSGDSATVSASIILIPTDWGNLDGMDTASTDYYASSGGAQTLPVNSTTVQFTNLSSPITVSLTIVDNVGGIPSRKYILNAGTLTSYTVPITINNNDTLKIALTTPGGIGSGIGTLRVTNVTTSTILDDINYSYNIE